MEFSELEINKARRLFLFLAHKMAGDRGLQIAASIISNGFLTDEQISEITGLSITSVRNILSILRNAGILHIIRQRDNSGWTLYYWGTDPLIVQRVFRERMKEAIKHLKIYLEYSVNEYFYYCIDCGVRVSKDVADANDYTCPVCGGTLVQEEPSTELIKFLEMLVEKYRKVSLLH